MFKKLNNKTKSMTSKNWIVLSLWLLTLILLFVFVGVTAGLDKDAKEHYATVVAAVALAFTISIFSAMSTTVFVKYIEKRKEENHG